MTPQAHRRYLPPADPPRESPARLLLAAVALVVTCAALYLLIVGLG